jgi:hypothetical protein
MTIPSIEQVIAAIPDWAGHAVTAERIQAGLTNTNWRVDVDDVPFFVRIPGADTDLLAVDRGNPSVAALYEPLHPAVLRMIRFVVRAAKAGAIPLSLCGEMAANPDLIPTLLGLGLRELSCPPRAVPRVREAIRATEIAKASREIEDKPA